MTSYFKIDILIFNILIFVPGTENRITVGYYIEATLYYFEYVSL